MKKKTLMVTGSGGREAVMVSNLLLNDQIEKIFFVPGNPAFDDDDRVKCVNIKATDIETLAQFAKEHAVDLTIVGPEDPLAMGMVDRFNQLGLKIFGPTQAMAQLEASKVWAKRFMLNLQIPSAPFFFVKKTGNEEADMKTVQDFLKGFPEGEAVIKGDGLAAGKGVEVSKDRVAAQAFARELLYGDKYGKHEAIVIERRLHGEECSIIAIVCGNKYLLLDSSQDHKPVFDGDEGPNTGGMGAYSPAPVVTPEMMKRIEDKILQPLVKGMCDEFEGGYRGVIYLGLMITEDGPKVLEINVRFGDPECQALFMRLREDLFEVYEEVALGQLIIDELEFDERPCVVVTLASRGYPESKEVGVPIYGWISVNSKPDTRFIHAGTKKTEDDGQLVTNGGRVAYVGALGDTYIHAVNAAYMGVSEIQFDGEHHRNDIGGKALGHVA